MVLTNNSVRTERYANPPIIDLIDTPVDTNASVGGDTIDLEGLRNVVLDVQAASGAHTTHVVKIWVSTNGAAWAAPSTPISVTGVGRAFAEVEERYCRYQVTTVEGGASTCHIQVQAKP